MFNDAYLKTFHDAPTKTGAIKSDRSMNDPRTEFIPRDLIPVKRSKYKSFSLSYWSNSSIFYKILHKTEINRYVPTLMCSKTPLLKQSYVSMPKVVKH